MRKMTAEALRSGGCCVVLLWGVNGMKVDWVDVLRMLESSVGSVWVEVEGFWRLESGVEESMMNEGSVEWSALFDCRLRLLLRLGLRWVCGSVSPAAASLTALRSVASMC